MNYKAALRAGGFSTGLGYGMGLMVGVVGGAVLVGAVAAAGLYGFVEVKKFLRKRKKAVVTPIAVDIMEGSEE